MLAIGIGTRASLIPHSDQPLVLLEDDGYYWFLRPLFDQLFEQTNQYVDPYGNAYFEGTSLDLLQETITTAYQQVESQPETWLVSTSASIDFLQMHREYYADFLQTHPDYKEVFEEVSKATFIDLLNQWDSLVKLARQQNLGIVCFGD
jgi:FMN phosphatase YigB (HAD superfamily)